jgi:cobyrinic acid a,c-diamide synthase
VSPLGVPVLGCLPRDPGLVLPARHLGLVQAAERDDLGAFLERASSLIERHVDLARLRSLARPARVPAETGGSIGIKPLGQRLAVARDTAFAFAYPALLESWRAAGAELTSFSPLADEAPDPEADAVYLPGGYPELHATRLAGNARFLRGLRAAAGRQVVIHGECGGYMVLGRGLVDGDGRRHAMAGLLPLETSFAAPKLHLGYRRAKLVGDCALGARGMGFSGHEFHYATISSEGPGEPLFHCVDGAGESLGLTGRRQGNVFGSFVHLIDALDDSPVEVAA